MWIHYLFVHDVDYKTVKKALSSNCENLRNAEEILKSEFIVYSVHTDAADFEDGSGIAEEILVNRPNSRDALTVLGIQ